MIVQALNFIRSDLIGVGVDAGLGNVADIISNNGNTPTSAPLVISMINIEENRISRDPQNYVRGAGGLVLHKKNPAIHLNLTVLFTSIRQEGGYELSLNDIQQVIGVFQKQYTFDSTTTPPVPVGIEKLILEMMSLNLEQLHQLWSMLGGKYYPSVAYRVRMLTIDSVSDEEGPLIEEIEANYKIK